MINPLWSIYLVLFTFFQAEDDMELKMLQRKWQVVEVAKESKVFATGNLPSELDFRNIQSHHLVKRPEMTSIIQSRNGYFEILNVTNEHLKLGIYFNDGKGNDVLMFILYCSPQD
jgi:hypothetical protein